MKGKSIKDRIKPIVYSIINLIPRRRLKNKNFTIIVHFKSAEKQGHVDIDLKTYHRYFNVVTWLNKGGEDLT
ncbi:hypothetical protein STRSA0001_1867 [Streptococcus salivarius SK126]|nr:hypothetical protein STRSA0001_1867 [Streptococcus salivarius SK126]